MAELSLRDVRAGYGETVVLEDIAFDLPERAALAILGRNGVGKTTLLATIMGHTTFHAGNIEYRASRSRGSPSTSAAGWASASFRRRGTSSLRSRSRRISPSQRAPAAGRWHASTISFPSSRAASALGQSDLRRRAADARHRRALMGNPTLLLMDEPLEGLAPIIVEVLLQALQRLIREDALAVVLVEQHAKLALGVTQSALVLNRGRIAYNGPSADLLADPRRLTSLVVA